MKLIGRHIDYMGDLYKIPDYAKKYGYNIFQILLSNPRRIISRQRTASELNQLHERLICKNMFMFIHSSYTVNLCNPITSSLHRLSVKSIVSDMTAAYKLGDRCLGVIIHMGRNVKKNNISDKQATLNYITGIETILNTTQHTDLILEMGASQGTEINNTIEELANILKQLNNKHRKRIKICPDTCHLWASGYMIDTGKNVDLFLKKFDRLIGIKKIKCIHLNNSMGPLNSHTDRHAGLKNGHIPIDGLIAFFRFATTNSIPIILETPTDSIGWRKELRGWEGG